MPCQRSKVRVTKPMVWFQPDRLTDIALVGQVENCAAHSVVSTNHLGAGVDEPDDIVLRISQHLIEREPFG